MFIIAVVNTIKINKNLNSGYASLLGGFYPGIVNENSRIEKSRNDMTLFDKKHSSLYSWIL